jgi:hypothetical protein
MIGPPTSFQRDEGADVSSTASSPSPRSFGYKIGGAVMTTLLSLFSFWALAALLVDLRPIWLATIAVLGFTGVLSRLWRGKTSSVRHYVRWTLLNVFVLTWWLMLSPKPELDWAPEFARTAWAEVSGDRAVVHNVRNFTYRTEHDLTANWETRTYDLGKIIGADLFLIRWGAPLVAHSIVSFRFSDGTYLATSIEARRTPSQEFSALLGFFRQFQIIYLVADERDVVRVRTNYRQNENVSLFRTRLTPADARQLLAAYFGWMNAAHVKPAWYNALTKNCSAPMTTFLAKSKIGGLSRWDWRGILDGRGDKMLYELGDLAGDELPFEQLKAQALINPVAREADTAANFSEQIRAGRAGFDK